MTRLVGSQKLLLVERLHAFFLRGLVFLIHSRPVHLEPPVMCASIVLNIS